MELALDRLLGAVQKEPALRPALNAKCGQARMGQPLRGGPCFTCYTWQRSDSAMKSSRSRTIAAFGLAPTMVLATSPSW